MKNKLFLLLLTLGFIFFPFGDEAAAQTVKKVVVDPGHGGKDSGAVGNGLLEKDLNLKIAQKVNRNLINNYDVETMMTRNSDIFLELKERTDLANNWGANLFLSIHINAGGGTGYEDYIHTTSSATSEDKKVQAEINKEINKVLEEYKKNNRGQKKANFHVLRESRMASVLLEILFIDNKADSALLKSEQFLNDISDAISTGVANAMALPKGKGVAVNPTKVAPVKEKIEVSKASGTYVVTADSLNIRTGDSTSYPVVGTLKKNAQVKVTGKTSKGWYQFTHNGKPAYVSGAYLKKKPAAPAPAPKPAPKPKSDPIKVSTASGTYIVTANSLNVRSGNGTKYNSLGFLKKNSQVKVTGKTSNNWYRITFKGKTGYVSGAYLKVKPKPKPAPKPAPKPKNNQIKVSKASGTYKVTASSLNVRSGNSTKFKSIGSLKKNNSIKVTGKTSNGWYRFSFKGKTGYVNGKYLKAQKAVKASAKITKAKSSGIKVSKASGTYKVTASSLNVRSGNSTKFKSIGSLKKNNSIKVTGKTSNGWYRFSFKGKTGYVNGKYLKAQKVVKASSQTVKAKSSGIKVSKASGTYKVTASVLNVRSGNKTSYSKIGSLTRGSKIKVTGKTSNGWYRINHKGKVGFVSGKYLKK